VGLSSAVRAGQPHWRAVREEELQGQRRVRPEGRPLGARPAHSSAKLSTEASLYLMKPPVETAAPSKEYLDRVAESLLAMSPAGL